MVALILVVPAGAQVNTLPAAPPPDPQETSATATIEPPPLLPLPASLKKKEWVFSAITMDSRKNEQGDNIKVLEGHAEAEDDAVLVRAHHIEYNEQTHVLNATGNVYFYGLDKNEQIWCDHLEYNRETENGAFFDVRMESSPRAVVRKGILSGTSPYHAEGEWAQRIGQKYILYNGWVTNCKIPDGGSPWWIMRGPKFDIIPRDRAKAYRSWFILRKVPLFYAPYFYHSLAKEQRHSGFLMPHIAPHTQRGVMVGLGYYWAINRSYDLTYDFLDYNTSALGHNVDLRGRPTAKSDFDLLLYGIQDRSGDPNLTPKQTFSGVNLLFFGKADLGHGWLVSSNVNYVTSFRFRQEWSYSYSEAVSSEFHSTAFLNKDWSGFTTDLVVSRLENFQTAEVPITSPSGSITGYERNAVLIHKLPEVQFGSRDRQLFCNPGDGQGAGQDGQLFCKLPIWLSLYSAAGLLYRSEPFFNSANTTEIGNFQTSQATPRLDFSPHLTSALRLGPIDLIPSVGLEETFYGESQVQSTLGAGYYQAISERMTRSTRDFSLDIILPSLERIYGKTIFGEKLKHVIEPRVTYKYVTGIGTDATCEKSAEAAGDVAGAGCSDFNHYLRFDNMDILSDTNEVTLSLTNRLYAKKKDGSVQEIFTWELMQKRYFDPTFGGAVLANQPNIFAATSDLTAYAFVVGPRTYSPIVSLVRASPIGGLGINWQTDYDPKARAIVDSSFGIDYRWHMYYASVSDNEVHANPILMPYANQYSLRAGFGDPQHRGWNAGIQGIYDYRANQLLQYTTQVTYNTNCCGFSVQYLRINVGQPHGAWEFALALANIGTFGSLKKNERWF